MKERKETLGMVALIVAIIVAILCLVAGCAETTQTKVYDPNAPELKYLAELTDPNWVRDVGISKESRVLFNVSVSRGMALQNRNILAEVARRLIALEASHIDPNESVVDPNEVKGLPGVCIRSDPNDPGNPDNIDSPVCKECHK